MIPAFLLSVVFSIYNVNPQYIEFGIIGDTQSRTKRQKRLLPTALLDMKQRGIRSFFHLGDADWGGKVFRYKRFCKKVRRFGLKVYPVLGNHDLSLTSWGYIIKPSLKWKWCKVYGLGNSYYYFDYFGYRFVVLDTSLTFTSRRQAIWLRNVLWNVKGKKVLLFMHRPLPTPHESAVYYKGSNYHNYDEMDPIPYLGSGNKSLWKVFYANRHKILVVFHGHYHSFRRYNLYGVPVFCSGGGGGPLEKKSDFYHYLIVRLYKNRFVVDVKKL